MAGAADFTWRDGERTIRFGRGARAEAHALIAGAPYALLTTARHRDVVPGLAEHAERVVEVPAGRVDEIAGALRDADATGGAGLLVALGGGRVIDVAKALAAAAAGGTRVAAIPTTLSAAEMTPIHRHAAGVAPTTPRVRPAIVVNDPGLCASQPGPELAASALNALGHACEGPLTTNASPVPALAGHEAARLIATAFAGQDRDPDRDALALGALLSGYAIGAAGYGIHHVLSQTLVRFAGVGHGPANAIMLPHTLEALQRRAPDRYAALEAAMREPPAGAAARICARTGATRLRERGVEQAALERCVEEAAGRAELALTPPPADREEIRALYASAY